MGNNGSKVGCWIAVVILGFMLFFSALLNLGLLTTLFSSGGAIAGTDYPMDEKPLFEEVWSAGAANGTKVVRIALEGVIMRGAQQRLIGSGPDMVENILSQIRCATIDADVKAIILEVDSPGGGVTPSDEIYAALEHFKRNDDERMIMVFVRGLCASGGYYTAMAGDYIMAEPTAIVGSVGVIMQTLNMQGLGEKVGLNSVTIASGKNKDMLNPFKEVNPEHIELLQELVDSMQERFASIVQGTRGLESRELLDGRVFNVIQAKQYNLIDGVGYWQDAYEKLKFLMGAEDLLVVRYYEPQGFLDSLLSAKTPEIPNFKAINSPRLMYLWKP